MMSPYNLTVTTKRNGHTDCQHPGWFTLVHSAGHVLYPQTPLHQPVFLRSCAKIIQAIPLIESGAHSILQLRDEQLAILCASHTGSAQHVDIVNSLLNKTSLTEDDLQCGAHPPIDRTERHHCIQHNHPIHALHHNCSGKHAGMLIACQARGWDVDTYLSPEHPLQQAIRWHISQFSEIPENQIATATDGCGVPTFYLPLHHIALLSSQLANSKLTAPLIYAIQQEPIAFGGLNRVDSMIVKVTNGRIIAKVGADGLITACHTEANHGLAYKIHSGHETYRNIAFIDILHQLGWLTDAEYAAPDLSQFTQKTLYNAAGKDIGRIHLKYRDDFIKKTS